MFVAALTAAAQAERIALPPPMSTALMLVGRVAPSRKEESMNREILESIRAMCLAPIAALFLVTTANAAQAAPACPTRMPLTTGMPTC